MRKKLCSLLFIVILVLNIIMPLDMAASVSNKTISLMGIKHSDGADRTSWIAPSAVYLQSVGNTNISQIVGFSISDILTEFNDQDMVAIHTHGAQNALLAYSADTDSYLTSSIISNAIPSGGFSQLRICYVGACSCGAGGSSANNLVNTIYSKGAICVIGYQDSVVTNCNRMMLQQFCYYIGSGYSVANALSQAEIEVFGRYGMFGNVDNRLVRGISSVAMTNLSYSTIGTSSYALDNYDSQTLNIVEEEILSNDGTNLCTKSGDMFSMDECGKIYSYIRLDVGERSEYNEKLDKNSFFESFDLNGYTEELVEHDLYDMICMRGFINDLKTNDVIYCSVNEAGEVVAYGYPRIGNAKEVFKIYDNMSEEVIRKYVKENYNISDIENIIIDVEEVENPVANVTYKIGDEVCECIEMLRISLKDID